LILNENFFVEEEVLIKHNFSSTQLAQKSPTYFHEKGIKRVIILD